jgi:3-oxoacyl-[acyl-carrier-protein] synthase-3
VPCTAAFVQEKLGAANAMGFDVDAGCSGFLYALQVGRTLIASGAYANVLVIGADALSLLTDYQSRETCVLFGDAAGAMVLAPETRKDHGLLSTHLYSDGTQWDILQIPGGGSRKPFSPEVWEKREQFIKMNGREVYKTAVRVLEASSRKALETNGYTTRDVTHVIAHQANLRILDAVMKRLEIPLEKCEVNIDEVGNTSSASVPLTLDQANRAGKLKDGDIVLMMAIGGGMAWGSALVRW